MLVCFLEEAAVAVPSTIATAVNLAIKTIKTVLF